MIKLSYMLTDLCWAFLFAICILLSLIQSNIAIHLGICRSVVGVVCSKLAKRERKAI